MQWCLVEKSLAEQYSNNSETRAISRYALDLAISELQESIGPDMRITASEYNESNSSYSIDTFNVWNANNGSKSVFHPISHTKKKHLSFDNSKIVTLYKNPINGTEIDAHPLKVRTYNKGKYEQSVAWWISDNGLKASINAHDLSGQINSSDYKESEGQLSDIRLNIMQTIGNYQRLDGFITTKGRSEEIDNTLYEHIENVILYNDLQNLKLFKSSHLSENFLQEHYHDFTVNNRFHTHKYSRWGI